MPSYDDTTDTPGLQDQIDQTVGATAPDEGQAWAQSLYKKYLGRSGSTPELVSHLGYVNGRDTGAWRTPRWQQDVTWSISNSPEAQKYAASGAGGGGGGGGGGTTTPGRMDDTYIRGIVSGWMGSNNPQKHSDADYWVRRIKETGGLGTDNMQYWLGRFTEAPGTQQEGGPGPGTNTNQLSNTQGMTNFSQFDDPSAQLLERLALDRVERLGQTPQRDALDAYTKRLAEVEAANRARGQELAGSFRERAAQLKGPAFSDQDEAALRAKSFDRLEQRRQETLKNSRENIYMRGFAPTSGIVAGSDRAINTDFERSRTGVESDLLRYMIDETQKRKDKATQLEALAQQALEGGDISSLQNRAQLADLEDSLIQSADQQERERLAAAGIPVDLGTSRTQLALQILGQGGSPESIIQSLLGIAGVGQQNRALNIAQRNSTMSGIGNLAGLVTNFLGNYFQGKGSQ